MTDSHRRKTEKPETEKMEQLKLKKEDFYDLFEILKEKMSKDESKSLAPEKDIPNQDFSSKEQHNANLDKEDIYDLFYKVMMAQKKSKAEKYSSEDSFEDIQPYTNLDDEDFYDFFDKVLEEHVRRKAHDLFAILLLVGRNKWRTREKFEGKMLMRELKEEIENSFFPMEYDATIKVPGPSSSWTYYAFRGPELRSIEEEVDDDAPISKYATDYPLICFIVRPKDHLKSSKKKRKEHLKSSKKRKRDIEDKPSEDIVPKKPKLSPEKYNRGFR